MLFVRRRGARAGNHVVTMWLPARRAAAYTQNTQTNSFLQEKGELKMKLQQVLPFR